MKQNYAQKARLPALFFALLLCTPIFVSCVEDTPTAETSGTTVTETTAETEEETAYTADYLPDVTYDGYEYRLIAYEEYPAHMTEPSGDLVDDAIYTRNMMVAEKYDVNFVETRYPYTNYNDVNTLMTNAGRAQSDDFDLAKLVFRHAFTGVTSGYIPAASNMPVIDMTKPWYVQKMNEKMVVDGVAMLAYTTFDKNPGGASIIFNKDMLIDLGLEVPYQMVYDGTWTYDVMYSMAEAAILDVDGDGTMQEGDRFGFIAEWDNMTDLTYMGSGLALMDFTRTPPELSQNEQLFDMFSMFIRYGSQKGFLFNTFGAYGAAESSRILGNQYFMQGGSLFMQRGTNTLTTLGDMEDDYGIVPFPKWTADQDGYYVGLDGSRIAVPLACSADLERVCVIKEALAVESLNINHPAYYENTLTKRYVRDTESIDMLEIITNSNMIDFGASLWSDIVRAPWMGCIEKNNADFASAIAAKVSQSEKAVQELMDIVADLK